MRGFGGVGSGGRHRFGMASTKPSGSRKLRTMKRTDLRLESLLYELSIIFVVYFFVLLLFFFDRFSQVFANHFTPVDLARGFAELRLMNNVQQLAYGS
jgi:hypothetical protein